MSARRYHDGLLEAAARDLDRKLRALSFGEAHRDAALKDHDRKLEALRILVDGRVEVRGPLAPIKRLIRRALRPYLVREARIDRLVFERLADLHAEVERLRAEVERAREDVLDELDRREPRSHATFPRIAGDSPDDGSIEPGSRLLLGHVLATPPGFLRIDPDDPARSDLHAALDRIPAPPGTVAEILAANVIERHSADEVRGVLLPHWASLLRPGATLTVIADDFEAAAERLRDGLVDAPGLAASLFAEGRPRRSAHTPETLRRDLAEAGFHEIRVVERAQRPEAGAYGFAIAAAAPAG